MSVSVLNTTASLTGKTLAKLEDSQTFTGAKTFDLGASAPFVVVAGSAKVTNLDADKLDGETGADFHNAALLTGLTPIANGGTGAATAAANLAFIGPASGAAAAPSFRALVAADDSTEQTTTATGAQNDFAPSAGATVVIRCTGAAPVFSGFTGGAAGRRIILEALGTTVKVVNQTLSTAANQIICESTQGQIVGVNGSILLVYDGTTSRWRASLLAAGSPITFTPTWAGGSPAIGDGTLTGRYRQDGNLMWVEIRMVAGGTTTFGAGTYTWSVPLTAANADRGGFSGIVTDAGTAIYIVTGSLTSTTALGVFAVAGAVGATVPMTWANTDELEISGTYAIS